MPNNFASGAAAVHHNSKVDHPIMGKEEVKVNGPKIGLRSSANLHKATASNGMINYATQGAGGFGS